jgi:hypothetical protein
VPGTTNEYERSVYAAPLCEQLRTRDLLDNVAIQVDGSFVAGYELSGMNSYHRTGFWRKAAAGPNSRTTRSSPSRFPRDWRTIYKKKRAYF